MYKITETKIKESKRSAYGKLASMLDCDVLDSLSDRYSVIKNVLTTMSNTFGMSRYELDLTIIDVDQLKEDIKDLKDNKSVDFENAPPLNDEEILTLILECSEKSPLILGLYND